MLNYEFPFKVAWSVTTHVTCNGGNDGELVITPYFGRGPYTYLWDHDAGLSDSTATNLIAGAYKVTVTDANNETAIGEYIITQPTAISLSETITNVLCYGGKNGEIALTISGGVGPYSQLWTGPLGYTSTAEDISGLFAGSYSVRLSRSVS